MKRIFILFLFIQISSLARAEDFPVEVRSLRIYGGGDERKPPIILLPTNDASIIPPFGESSVTIELDINAPVPPGMYARFVHCGADWREDENIFINDITKLRTSNILWNSAPPGAKFYTFRGVLSVPDIQIKFEYSGNWKVKFYDLSNDTTVLAEGRFFVVQPLAETSVSIFTDFYEPEFKVNSSALGIEVAARTPSGMYDSQLQTAVVYRNFRWYEPYVITQNSSVNNFSSMYRNIFPTHISGFANVAKRFRIEQIPPQTEYRVLDLSNPAIFPRITAPVRQPLADLRRNGNILFTADDGAMIARYTQGNDDDYVNMEFVLDPDRRPSRRDVFILGSFNNWRATREWQMYYDEVEKLYKLRAPIRRARHNYLYATGEFNSETGQAEKLSFEEFEGNNLSSVISYLGFVYYREMRDGGYDALIGLGAANIYGTIRR